jgi:hypothetical protein
MDKFINDLNGIYELITNENSKSFINVKMISKQYLNYYIYRIISKYIMLTMNAVSNNELEKYFKLLRIPKEHNKLLTYPMGGKMTNDEELLDIIFYNGTDILNKIDKYLQSLKNISEYQDFFEFIERKDLQFIIQDLIDLQKLVPGLSVSAIRPNYIIDSTL